VPGRAGVVDWEQLRGWAVQVLRLAGASEDAADAPADACLYASRRGLDSHGIVYLATYLPRLREGVIDGAARPAVVGGTDALAVIDGCSAAGALVARFAMDWCCDRAAHHGIAAAVVRRVGRPRSAPGARCLPPLRRHRRGAGRRAPRLRGCPGASGGLPPRRAPGGGSGALASPRGRGGADRRAAARRPRAGRVDGGHAETHRGGVGGAFPPERRPGAEPGVYDQT
jgi:hypothetical protein